ncbi:hypothetical protein [Bacillus thuringiensis]|uniref:hypothetical protein n=1 Tax=Bacillus thuringiensis TaxID=1428 RepID=UPI0020D26F8C|nr:hypothetical protein [Bacillus thuringiensis]
MTISNKFWTRLFTILVALNLATAIVSTFLQKWWLVSAGLGGACLMAAIGLVIKNGKATKLAAIFFYCSSFRKWIRSSKTFLDESILRFGLEYSKDRTVCLLDEKVLR